MKSLVILTLALGMAPLLPAQTGQYTPDQLDQLVAPVALYPDPLLALVLPASTKPDDIQAAAQYLSANGDPAGIDSQAWDPSVKGLAHYPDVINWMSQNMDWTQALGAAFAMQPQDIMQSVQQLRAKARAAGTLVDTPQQHVDVEGDDIRIVPAEDNTIYVPEYDPDDVYDAPSGDEGPLVTFDAGYPVGAWLGYECDWDDFGIWVGAWQPGWAYRRDWRDPRGGGARWHPDARAGHSLVRAYFRPSASIPAPHVIAGARVAAHGRPAPQRAPARAAPGPAPRPVYRGYGDASKPSGPAPAPSLYGGYGRGTQARDYSARGRASRGAPVRSSAPRASAPRSAPSRSAPSGSGRDRH
ncbi:MAG TPA: DUF3300 domain-containing protein [Opitutaceae bacterium]|jgi:hypothetical protein